MADELRLSPLFDWRAAVASAHGPSSPTTRHVLLTLSLYMSVKGDSCFPSTRSLSEASGLSRRAVESHLRVAEEEGWILRGVHGYGGQRWKRYEYVAKIPQPVINAISAEHPKGGERGSPPRSKGGERRSQKVGNEVPMNTSVEYASTTNGAWPHPSSLRKDGSRYEYPDQFEDIWGAYPDRIGGNPKKGAYRVVRARIKEGATPEDLKCAAEAYAKFCKASGRSGTEHVMQARTFFGPDEHFDQDWSAQAKNGNGGGSAWLGNLKL